MRTVRISKEMMEATQKMIVAKKAQKKEEKREERKEKKTVKRLDISLEAVTRALQLGYKKVDIYKAIGCSWMGFKLYLRRHGWKMPALRMKNRPTQPLTKELLEGFATVEPKKVKGVKISKAYIIGKKACLQFVA